MHALSDMVLKSLGSMAETSNFFTNSRTSDYRMPTGACVLRGLKNA